MSLAQARANRAPIDWANYSPPVPRFLGAKTFTDVPLASLTPYIDWMPFFNAWEFTGTFPAVLAKDNIVATQFHPEKSGDHGLRIYANFLAAVPVPAR